MTDYAYPQHELKAYSPKQGFLSYVFQTAGAGANPTMTAGNTQSVASCVYSAVGIYTITLRPQWTDAFVFATLAGGADDESVVVKSITMGRWVPNVLVVKTTKAHVAAALNGPVVEMTVVTTP